MSSPSVSHPRTARARGLAAGALRQWHLHPRWAMALRGAVAAAVAWVVGIVLPQPFSDYPYYAPLGAVVATTSTVARSVRESFQAVGAIVVGALVARGADLVLAPSALSIALVVAVAILVAGWGLLGDMGSWAVTSALFVLIIGNADKVGYMGAYIGLVLVGSLVGIGINLLFPPLPLAASDVELDRLRSALADQLDHLADGLDSDVAPSPEEWDDRRLLLGPVVDRSQRSAEQAREAARINRRARRYAEATRAQGSQAAALGVTSSVVGDLTRLVTGWERQDLDDLAFGESLRPLVRDALRAYADAVRSTVGALAEPEALDRVRDTTERLRRAVRDVRSGSDEDYFVAGATVLAIRRGVAALGEE
ncbi:FUSC family protein [Oerskovia paurometabola]|uniref:Aromatic acid exporter family protein n=1 Tax=Oerskovia paurometabola TaxID=162170 RepID=A0ABW1XEJ5_9CELL|nr:hypothetical protein [Oerskovia paurometabola]MBM7496138.1 hypothetical protein [Oerskovia paurometabola]